VYQIHDKGYKKLFKNKSIFQQLLETFVPEAWIKELDFNTCESLDKSFISDHYKETASDIIYKVKRNRRNSFVVILMEFKSTVERFITLHLANYITNFYMDYVESTPNVKLLPPVFPILLYNGDKEWTAPTKISEVIDDSQLLGKYALNFEYFAIPINKYDREYLLKIKNVVSILFLAEAHYDAELLEQLFLEVFEREADKGPISLLLNWFVQLSKHGKIPEEDVDELERIYTSKEEVRQMLITALKKEKQEIFDQGKREGEREGKREGDYERQIMTAHKMISKGFEIALIAEITGLSEAEILKLKQDMQTH
jgi:predicted transposase/invertase (TIGR01784 family)